MNPVLQEKRAKKLCSLFSCILLSACTVPKENFDCKPGKGLGCQPIHAVNQWLDAQKDFSKISARVEAQSLAPAPETASLSIPIPAHLKDKDHLVLQRVEARALSIWFAPFSDEQGHVHEASTVHVVLKPSTWQCEESF
jgi:type IV conjugative transfer system lipoprotein TraV